MTEPLASIRNCDGCTLCCKIFRIAALEKPKGQWCSHCSVGKGCEIYDTRPEECRAFKCGYLVEPGLDEGWKPSEARLLLSSQGRTLSVHVDPQRPDAWKRAPYYASMKQWAKEALPLGSQVAVWIGDRAIMILPDRDVDLGIVAPDEIAVTTRVAIPGGVRYEALKLKKSDPRAANLAPADFSMAAAARGDAAR
jgi:hypothetical protein